MFAFFHKKREVPSELGGLRCDVHSHLIPGIDDGSPDLETSVRLIRGLIDLGYQKIITTPHINVEGFPNTPEVIHAGQELVEAELRRLDVRVPNTASPPPFHASSSPPFHASSPPPFHAAAEYLLDDGFSRLLAAGKPLLVLKGNLVLVELSFAVPAINLRNILFEMQVKGYQPVLAHPERYLYFNANRKWYDQLRDAGCFFQLNLLSFAGYYGPDSRSLAEWLVKKRYIDLVGTDLHHDKHLEVLKSSTKIHRTVAELLQAGLVKNPEL